MATNPKTIFDDVKPWPDQKPAPAPAHIGHNKPPLEEIIPVEFRAEIQRERPEFFTKMEDAIAAAERATANDDETLGKCGDLVNIYRACLKHVGATHTAVKAPHLLACRLIDAEKNALVERLDAAKRKVEAIGNAFVAKREAAIKAERERAAAEERRLAAIAAEAEQKRVAAEREAEEMAAQAKTDADRKAAQELASEAAAEADQAMAAAALAPAPAAKAEPVRSDSGAAVSGRKEWKSEVEDYTVAFAAVADHEKVREAIDKAIAQQVKSGRREIPGVRIWPVAKANFR